MDMEVQSDNDQPLTDTKQQGKYRTKWSSEEDATIIRQREGGKRWKDISLQLPGRSAMACRLRYQNYLEKTEDAKNKLASAYNRYIAKAPTHPYARRSFTNHHRLKSEIWTEIGNKMSPLIPWRAVEAMIWQMGQGEIARRAGGAPFSQQNSQRRLMARPERSSCYPLPPARDLPGYYDILSATDSSRPMTLAPFQYCISEAAGQQSK
jgi:hypothetical protein